MKRFFMSLYFLTCIIPVVHASIDGEVEQFFHGEKHETTIFRLQDNNDCLFFSYIETAHDIYKKAVFYRENEVLLFLETNKVTTPYEVLFKSSLANFWGWRIDQIFPDLWISTTIIQGVGQYVTDGPSFFMML